MTDERRPTPQQPVDVRAALLEAGHGELTDHGDVAGVMLRAVARRAGVSHAAPKHHFGDRKGLLTAVATDGFDRLHDQLQRAAETVTGDEKARLAAVGRAYVEFGLQQPGLLDLMFRGDQLRVGDPAMTEAQERAFAVLRDAMAQRSSTSASSGPTPPSSGAEIPSMVAWIFAHGLVGLARDGTLERAAAQLGVQQAGVPLIRLLTDAFAILTGTPPHAGQGHPDEPGTRR